jgi:hypothetical protein
VALSEALSKSPVERFGTCSQFASALESAFSTTPSVLVPAVETAKDMHPRLGRIPMLVTRNHVVTIAIVAFLLAIGLFFLRVKQSALKPASSTHSQTAARNKGEGGATKTVETSQTKSPPISQTQSTQNSTASKNHSNRHPRLCKPAQGRAHNHPHNQGPFPLSEPPGQKTLSGRTSPSDFNKKPSPDDRGRGQIAVGSCVS